MKKVFFSMLTVVAFSVTGCFKDCLTEKKKYLKFSNTTVHLANKPGATSTIEIQSNVEWQLEWEEPAPNWISIDNPSGSNGETRLITAKQSNSTGGYRFATIVAKAVNKPGIAPARLIVVQEESTSGGK